MSNVELFALLKLQGNGNFFYTRNFCYWFISIVARAAEAMFYLSLVNFQQPAPLY